MTSPAPGTLQSHDPPLPYAFTVLPVTSPGGAVESTRRHQPLALAGLSSGYIALSQSVSQSGGARL